MRPLSKARRPILPSGVRSLPLGIKKIPKTRLPVIFIFLLLAIPSANYGQGGIELGEGAQGQPADYNLKFGSLHVGMAAFARVTYDSNFERNGANETATTSLVQGLKNDFFWSPNPNLSIDTELEITYTRRSGEASEFDGLEIRGGPGTGRARISADLRVGDSSIINFLEYSQGLQEGRIATGTGQEETANFEQKIWALGTRYRVQMTPYSTFSADYRFSRSTIPTREFQDLERDQQTFNVGFDTRLNTSMTVGLFLNPTLSRFNSDERSDSNSYGFGLRHAWQTSWSGQLNTRLGLQYSDISQPTANERSDGGLSPLFSTELTLPGRNGREHRFYFSYSEEDSDLVARNNAVAVDSRQTVLRTGYRVKANLRPSWDLELSTGLNQISGDSAGTQRSAEYGLNSSYALGLNWQISLSYRYSNRFDGGAQGETFDRHLSSFSFSYDF